MEQTLFVALEEVVTTACNLLDLGTGTNLFSQMISTFGVTGLTGMVIWGMLFD